MKELGSYIQPVDTSAGDGLTTTLEEEWQISLAHLSHDVSGDRLTMEWCQTTFAWQYSQTRKCQPNQASATSQLSLSIYFTHMAKSHYRTPPVSDV